MLDSMPNIAPSLSKGMHSLFEYGGFVSVILLCLSLVAFTLIIYKAIQLYATQRIQSRSLDRTLEQISSLPLRELHNYFDKRPGPFADMMAFAIMARSHGVPDRIVREEVERRASGLVRSWRSYLPALEAIGSISPLLGLFGTVLGMIEAFQALEKAGAKVDPSILSGGIWQALFTTGVGLAVAIPSVLAYIWLDRKANSKVSELEDRITRVFTGLSIAESTNATRG